MGTGVFTAVEYGQAPRSGCERLGEPSSLALYFIGDRPVCTCVSEFLGRLTQYHKGLLFPQHNLIRTGMRGKGEQQLNVFSYVSPEQRVPQDHPLRSLRAMTDEALRDLQPRFNKL